MLQLYGVLYHASIILNNSVECLTQYESLAIIKLKKIHQFTFLMHCIRTQMIDSQHLFKNNNA